MQTSTKLARKVTGLTVKKDGVTVHFDLDFRFDDNQDNITAHHSFTATWKPHTDLVERLKKLRVHYVLICNQSDVAQLEQVPESLIEKFVVTGFKVGGDDDDGEGKHEGVTITGYRKCNNGKVINMVAPFTKFSETITDYPHAAQLSTIIELLKMDGLEYIDGKRETPIQTEMQFDERGADMLTV